MGKKNKPLTYGDIPRETHKMWSKVNEPYEWRMLLCNLDIEVCVLLKSNDWFMYAIMTNPKWVERRVKADYIDPKAASDCYYYAKRHGLDGLAKLIRDDAIATIHTLPTNLIMRIGGRIDSSTIRKALRDTTLSTEYVRRGMTESKLWVELKDELYPDID